MKKQKKDREMLKNQQNIGTKKNWRNMNKCNGNSNGEFIDSFKKIAYFFVIIILTTGPILLAISALKSGISMESYIETMSEISKLQGVFDRISVVVFMLLICRIFLFLKIFPLNFKA